MSLLSSHSLFHFTHDLDTLHKILTLGLKYGLITEKIPGNPLIYMIPSISFCNIPLSSIHEHKKWYGSYAIGFKPDFVRRIGGTPVLYCHNTSHSLLCSRGHKHLSFYENHPITPYLKRVSGMQPEYKTKRLRFKYFYNEKEWRVVDKAYFKVLSIDDNGMKDKIEKDYSSRVPHYCDLSFDSITHIMVKNQKEIPYLVNWMEGDPVVSSYCIDYPEFVSRIISFEQIQKDV